MKKVVFFSIMLIFIDLHEATGQWNTSGSDIYNTNPGNVGIGNNAPSTLLYVAKSITEPAVTVRNLGGTGGATFRMWDNAGGADWKFKATNAGGFKIRDNANGLDVIVIESNSSANALYIKSGGKIGIGTATPAVKLDVRGDNPDWGAGFQIGNSDLSHMLKFFPGRQSQPYANIQWKAGDPLRFGTDETGWSEKMRITNDGSIGIGTPTPAATAILDMASTSKGFLPPRLTEVQISAISGPSDGMIAYCTTDDKYYTYVTTTAAWKEIVLGAGTLPPTCNPVTVNHVAGAVAPVTKTVAYGVATNIPGEPTKCWITSNLGADHQATAVDDATEASAGWYWQFNRMQGYKHDGTTRTPNTTWIYPIDEDLNWQSINDPCALELGPGWRIPSYTEWNNVKSGGNWASWGGPWNSSLKMHAAGHIATYLNDCTLNYRGSYGFYWSNKQFWDNMAWEINFYSGSCSMSGYFNSKSDGNTIRCLHD